MRTLFGAAVLLMLTWSPAQADTVVEIPLNQPVELNVPHPQAIQLSLGFFVDFQLPADFHPGDQAGYSLVFSFPNGPPAIVICASTNPGPCGGTSPSALSNIFEIVGGFDSNFIEVDFGGLFYYGGTVPDFHVAAFATLPDGFSVAAVPEPSTWAMLLIGFASVGYMTVRRRNRYGIPATF